MADDEDAVALAAVAAAVFYHRSTKEGEASEERRWAWRPVYEYRSRLFSLETMELGQARVWLQ
jgi:hypothetical protein